MIENLKRIREPLAWTLIGLTVANVLLGAARLVRLQQEVSLFEAFASVGTSLLNLALVMALIVVVCTCFFIAPASPRAHLLTRTAAWVLTVGVLLTLVCLILGALADESFLSRTLELIGAVLDLVLKAIAAGSLWLLLRGVGAGRIDVAPELAGSHPDPDPGGATMRPPATTWSRDQAIGSAWGTADEAAAGSPGSNRISSDPAQSPPQDSETTPGSRPNDER